MNRKILFTFCGSLLLAALCGCMAQTNEPVETVTIDPDIEMIDIDTETDGFTYYDLDVQEEIQSQIDAFKSEPHTMEDPLLIFKLESVNLFDSMVKKINDQTISVLMRAQIPVREPEQVREAAPDPLPQQRPRYTETKQDLSDPNQQAAAARDTREVKREPIRNEQTIGRNDPCPCGSGKKYKNCHGRNLYQ